MVALASSHAHALPWPVCLLRLRSSWRGWTRMIRQELGKKAVLQRQGQKQTKARNTKALRQTLNSSKDLHLCNLPEAVGTWRRERLGGLCRTLNNLTLKEIIRLSASAPVRAWPGKRLRSHYGAFSGRALVRRPYRRNAAQDNRSAS